VIITKGLICKDNKPSRRKNRDQELGPTSQATSRLDIVGEIIVFLLLFCYLKMR
jgi:hypothetical protein